MPLDFNRRSFLGAGAASLGYFYSATASSAARLSRKPNETLQFASIGVGGKGSSDVDNVSKLGEVIAICDVDDASLDPKLKKWSSVKKYYDFRKMLDEIG